MLHCRLHLGHALVQGRLLQLLLQVPRRKHKVRCLVVVRLDELDNVVVVLHGLLQGTDVLGRRLLQLHNAGVDGIDVVLHLLRYSGDGNRLDKTRGGGGGVNGGGHRWDVGTSDADILRGRQEVWHNTGGTGGGPGLVRVSVCGGDNGKGGVQVPYCQCTVKARGVGGGG